MNSEDIYFLDEWLTSIFQYNVYSINWNLIAEDINLIPALEFDRLLTQAPVFIYVKLPTGQTGWVQKFESAGFRVVDTGAVFMKEGAISFENKKSLKVYEARAEDRERTCQIARNNLTWSRFHLDPLISNDLAGEIKAKWVGNYFSGNRGDAMVVCEYQNRICGFVQAFCKPGELIIDLIAVDHQFRKLGVGKAMLVYLQEKFMPSGVIRAGTQIANPASLSFYETLGFRIHQSFYTLHYHN